MRGSLPSKENKTKQNKQTRERERESYRRAHIYTHTYTPYYSSEQVTMKASEGLGDAGEGGQREEEEGGYLQPCKA